MIITRWKPLTQIAPGASYWRQTEEVPILLFYWVGFSWLNIKTVSNFLLSVKVSALKCSNIPKELIIINKEPLNGSRTNTRKIHQLRNYDTSPVQRREFQNQDVHEMLGEREAGATQGKRMKSFKSSFTMYRVHWRRWAMESISQKNEAGSREKYHSFVRWSNIYEKRCNESTEEKTRVKYDALFHEMYFNSLPSKLWDFSYVCNQII